MYKVAQTNFEMAIIMKNAKEFVISVKNFKISKYKAVTAAAAALLLY